MFEWKLTQNNIGGEIFFGVWRQTRELRPGEPMHSGVRETKGYYKSREEAQEEADRLNNYEKTHQNE